MGGASGQVLGLGASGSGGANRPYSCSYPRAREANEAAASAPPTSESPLPHRDPGADRPVQKGVSPGERRGGRHCSQLWGGQNFREVDAGPGEGALGKQEDPCSSWGRATHRPGGRGTERGGSAHLSCQSHQITRSCLDGPDAKHWGSVGLDE